MQRPGGLFFALATLFVVGLCGATPHLLGRKECTYGPSYWCENIPQSKQCNAFQHCKQTVWESHVFPKDNDSICKICLDMVTQARDQLRSNETMEELKEVFEGSCNLIPIKIARKECDAMVDNFIPELVETLSSEMDPTAVCSVAGLCNNKRYDQLLLEQQNQQKMDVRDEEFERAYKDFSCEDCGKIGQIMVDRFQNAHPDDVLDAMLNGCRYTGSFSDGCASLAIVYFKDLYDVLKERLTKEGICHLSGACALGYHKHDEVEIEDMSGSASDELEIRNMGNVGLISRGQPIGGDDVPCELCEQLMVHLREVVLANTTKKEFEQVLDGICGEMKGKLAEECKGIVDTYADSIYEALNLSLNPQLICSMIGICPNKNKAPLMMPLLALEPAKIAISLKKVGPVYTKEEVDAFQLPFDTLMGPQNADQLVGNGEVCTICEMVLHFIQQSMAQPDTEHRIIEDLDKVCKRMPKSIEPECENFVQTYGEAVLSMLVQEVDPSRVCPMLKMCSQRVKEDVEIFETKQMNVEIQSKEKPTCPLCLFAVTDAQESIKSNKSIANIKHTLENLCNHLPQKLNVECTDFVDAYAKQLVEMLLKDWTPQQICVALQLCTQEKDKAVPDFKRIDEVDSMENEIPDNTVNGRVVVMGHLKPPSSVSTPECLVCQELVKELEKKLDDKHSREQIKKVLDHVCDKVKEAMKDKCVAFINAHEEQIINLVMKGVSPKELCVALGFCMISSERETIEDVFDRVFNPVVDDLDIDEAFSIDFISIPAGPSSVGRISLTNQEREKEKQQVIENRQPPKVRANEGCVLCEFIMTKLEADMKNKKTQEEIKHIVENVCTGFPKTIRSKCTKFIDQYSDMIVMLLTTVPPAEVCQEIKMCTPPAEEVVQQVSNDVLECAVCQGAVTVIDRLLEDPNFDRDAEKVVEKTCSVAPKLYKSKCAEMVAAYTPTIINQLLLNAQPEKVCETIHLCFPNEVSMFLQINDEVIPSRIRKRRQVALGAQKCTWGPSYWCNNLANAQECNAMNHCLEKHWNGVPPSA